MSIRTKILLPLLGFVLFAAVIAGAIGLMSVRDHEDLAGVVAHLDSLR